MIWDPSLSLRCLHSSTEASKVPTGTKIPHLAAPSYRSSCSSLSVVLLCFCCRRERKRWRKESRTAKTAKALPMRRQLRSESELPSCTQSSEERELPSRRKDRLSAWLCNGVVCGGSALGCINNSRSRVTTSQLDEVRPFVHTQM